MKTYRICLYVFNSSVGMRTEWNETGNNSEWFHIYFIHIQTKIFYSTFYGTPDPTFSCLFLSCAHKLLIRFNNIITSLNDLLCRTHKFFILF